MRYEIESMVRGKSKDHGLWLCSNYVGPRTFFNTRWLYIEILVPWFLESDERRAKGSTKLLQSLKSMTLTFSGTTDSIFYLISSSGKNPCDGSLRLNLSTIDAISFSLSHSSSWCHSSLRNSLVLVDSIYSAFLPARRRFDFSLVLCGSIFSLFQFPLQPWQADWAWSIQPLDSVSSSFMTSDFRVS